MAWVGGPHDTAPRAVDPAIDLLGLIDLVLRRKWLILGIAAAITALAFAALSFVGPRYQATVRLMIDPRELRIVESQSDMRELANDMVLVESQVEIITSEAVLRRVVQRENLTSDPDFYEGGSGQGAGRTPEEVALEGLAQVVKVTRPENTYILEIAVRMKQPAKAARLANAIAAAYTEDQAAAAAGNTLDLSTSIGGRLAELQAKLREDEEKVTQFKTEHGIAAADGRLLLDTRVNDLSGRLSVAVGETAQAKSRFDVMQNAMSTRGDVSSVLSETENATMVGLRSTLSEAQRRLAELQQILGPRHPRVGAAQAEVERAQRAIRSESERLVAATRDAWRAAQETERTIAAGLKELTDESFAANDRLIELRELERQAQASRLVYESYLVRAKETAELGNIGARSARIIAPAAVPDRPVFPPRSMLLAAALAFGLGLGLVAAILADMLERRRLSPSAAGDVHAAYDDRDADRLPPEPAPNDRIILTFAVDDGMLSADTALDLARGMADEGFATVLVDLSDTRSPGLAELSRGEVNVADVLSRDLHSPVHCAGAGNAWAGFDAGRIQEAFTLLADTYERVVINAGVLHGPAGALAAPAVAVTDHALLVIPDAEMTEAEDRAYRDLADAGVTVSVLSLSDEALPAAA